MNRKFGVTVLPKYITKQRKALLNFLKKHSDEPLSVKMISSALENENISPSSIYRNIAMLEAEGVVKYFAKNSAGDNLYRYVKSEHCQNSLHMACRSCGKCFHMDNIQAEKLIKDIEKNSGFLIEKSETMLYGICENCKKQS